MKAKLLALCGGNGLVNGLGRPLVRLPKPANIGADGQEGGEGAVIIVRPRAAAGGLLPCAVEAMRASKGC